MSTDHTDVVTDLGWVLRRAARRYGSKIALVAGGRTLTYGFRRNTPSLLH